VKTLPSPRALSPARVGLIIVAAVVAMSRSTADVGDPEPLPALIQQSPARSTESLEPAAFAASEGPAEEISSGSKSRFSAGAGGSIWLSDT
jgi:hypothetical protein